MNELHTLYSSSFNSENADQVQNAMITMWGEADQLIDLGEVEAVVEELLDNTLRHSGPGAGTVSLLRCNQRIVARVEDSGVGIHHNMAAASDEISVELAFEPGPLGTSTGSGLRGGGLWLAKAATAAVPGLTLALYSGNTCYTASNGEGRICSGSGDFHQGVIVELICPLSE